jgi:glutamate formiminotransferase
VILECVANVSEGRDAGVLTELARSAGPALLDLHRDPHHHRAVLTLAGPRELVAEAARSLASATLRRLELTGHRGTHPRQGVLDVVPFVPYEPGHPPVTDLTTAVAARDEFARWLGAELNVPVFLYGPLSNGSERTLPELRRLAFTDLSPDFGPDQADPRKGATAVGARKVLVAYNVWVSTAEIACKVAPLVRGPHLRALGLTVGDRAQVSCNLVEPSILGPAQAFDTVTSLVREFGGVVEGAELVGLLPETVLSTVPRNRWSELGLSAERTVESRLARGTRLAR